MRNNQRLQMLTMGSVALIVSGGAIAGAPTSPVTSLSAHSALNYAISQTPGIAGAGNYDSNGDLLTAGLTCGNGGTVTCTVMDGTGDGMIQYKVTDNTNTAAPKSHIELVVGQMYDGGLFLSDTFVNYGGGTSLNSMANKLVIEDQTELAAAGTGFSLTSEWLRGSYQTFQPSATFNALTNTSGALMDSIVDMNIGGVETFHAEGQNGASDSQGDWNQGNAELIDIQSGTTAANTSSNAADAAAMGVFHTRNQGGAALGTYNYEPGANTIVLGGQTLALGPIDGVAATYIHQDQAGMGFNGSPTDSYATDDPTLRDFAYVKFVQVDVTGFPPVDIGKPQDPMLGQPQQVASLTTTSQVGVNGALGGLVFPTNNNVREPDFNGVGAAVGVNDPSTYTNGEFLTSNVTNIQAAWSTIFGTGPQ